MITLILGDSSFSDIVLQKIKKKKIKHLIIDFSKNNKFRNNINSYKINIGKFGEIINLIKSKKSKKVLFAGKISKPNFSSLKLDFKGIYYMPSIIKAAKIGDAAIIKLIVRILSKEGIQVINSTFFNPELSLKKGNFSKSKPTKQDIISINKGKTYFNKINNLDHVQALIIKDGKIIAKEGREGTKKMLSRLKIGKGCILIKLPKIRQDLRIDLPTIGIETLKDAKKIGLKGIVLKSKKNIVLDKKNVISYANRNKIFIYVI